MARRDATTVLVVLAAAGLAACGRAHTLEQDRVLFKKQRPLFDAMVQDIRDCKGLRYDSADGPSKHDVCVESESDLPKTIADDLKRAHVRSVMVWREVGQGTNLGAPDRIIAISFVTGSEGFDSAAGSRIEFFETPPATPAAMSSANDAYTPLEPAPAHWFYNRVKGN